MAGVAELQHTHPILHPQQKATDQSIAAPEPNSAYSQAATADQSQLVPEKTPVSPLDSSQCILNRRIVPPRRWKLVHGWMDRWMDG